MNVTAVRKLGVLVLVLGGVLVGLSPNRRTRLARKVTQTRRFVSRRIAARDANDGAALERWDTDGGAKKGAVDAAIR